MAQRVAATLALGCILVLIIVHAEATDRLQAQRSGQRSWQRSWQRSAVELQADGHGAASASSGAAGHPHSTRRRTLTATGSTGVPAGAPIPHIIHHMHKNINALDATQAMLRKVSGSPGSGGERPARPLASPLVLPSGPALKAAAWRRYLARAGVPGTAPRLGVQVLDRRLARRLCAHALCLALQGLERHAPAHQAARHQQVGVCVLGGGGPGGGASTAAV